MKNYGSGSHIPATAHSQLHRMHRASYSFSMDASVIQRRRYMLIGVDLLQLSRDYRESRDLARFVRTCDSLGLRLQFVSLLPGNDLFAFILN